VWTTDALAVAGGFVAGIINTLAGSGSAITLGLMTEVLGLPGPVANATNRVGVLMQTYIGSYTFYRHGKLSLAGRRTMLVLLFAGASIGIWLAIQIGQVAFARIFHALMVLMLIVVLLQPRRWLQQNHADSRLPAWLLYPGFFLLGVYSGFIQMGMGVFFLALMVLGRGVDLIRANALKVFVVAVLTTVSLAVFVAKGMVHWRTGLFIGTGQALGGWLAARFGSLHPRADVWAYRLLVLMLAVMVIKMLV